MKKLIVSLGLTLALVGQAVHAGQTRATSNDDLLALLLAGAVTTVIVASALDQETKTRVEHHYYKPEPKHWKKKHHWHQRHSGEHRGDSPRWREHRYYRH